MLGLQVHHLGKQYLGRWLFQGLSFQVSPGGVLALMGPNGSGKSTLLRVLAGQARPSMGRVTWQHGQHPLAATELYKWVDWALPSLEPYASLPIQLWVRAVFALRGCVLPGGVEEALTMMGLTAQQHLAWHALSSGQQQRLRLAVALFGTGGILVLDEPTQFLDDYWAAQLPAWLVDYRRGRTLLMATHRRHEIPAGSTLVQLG